MQREGGGKMDRKEIKELAKAKIKGNKWNIWWPYLIITVISEILNKLISGGTTINLDMNNLESISTMTVQQPNYFLELLIILITAILSSGYTKYILDFVRTGKFDANTIIETIKKKWLNILIAEAIAYVLIFVGSLLFVIPGIIAIFCYAFVGYVVIDNDISGIDALKKSREMIKGYKWDYFVFGLSFIGWALLVPFTLGLLLIWLLPYMLTAMAIYYDKLKEKKNA